MDEARRIDSNIAKLPGFLTAQLLNAYLPRLVRFRLGRESTLSRNEAISLTGWPVC